MGYVTLWINSDFNPFGLPGQQAIDQADAASPSFRMFAHFHMHLATLLQIIFHYDSSYLQKLNFVLFYCSAPAVVATLRRKQHQHQNLLPPLHLHQLCHKHQLRHLLPPLHRHQLLRLPRLQPQRQVRISLSSLISIGIHCLNTSLFVNETQNSPGSCSRTSPSTR
jgi:hypothetical protein